MRAIFLFLTIFFLSFSTGVSAFSLFDQNAREKTAEVNEAQPVVINRDHATSSEQIQSGQVERQVSYLHQLNIPQKFDRMQQEIQALRGLVEQQGHQIKQLETQQRNLYADLDARLTRLARTHSSTEKGVTEAKEAKEAKQTSSTSLDKQVEIYQSAFSLIKEKKYSQAIKGMKKYLQKYPSGKYAPNSHYWLGELYLRAGDNRQAMDEFNTVVTSYADSNKVPDAMLQLGFIEYDQSQWIQARRWWKKVMDQYPDSSTARIAETRLVDLAKEGH